MTDDELSQAIADRVNGLCLEYGGQDKRKAMNAMANICNFCICSMMANMGEALTVPVVEEMLGGAVWASLKDEHDELIDSLEGGQHDAN